MAFMVSDLMCPVAASLAQRDFLGQPMDLLLALPEMIGPRICEGLVGLAGFVKGHGGLPQSSCFVIPAKAGIQCCVAPPWVPAFAGMTGRGSAALLAGQTLVVIGRLQLVHRRFGGIVGLDPARERSEEHTSELQSLMRISYAVFCLKKKTNHN